MIYIIISTAMLLLLWFFLQYNLSYQDFQIGGVLFAPEHSRRKDTQRLLKKYRRLLAAGIFIFVTLQFLFLLPPLRKYLDISLIFIPIGYLVYGFIVLERARRAFISFKEKHGWHYERSAKRRADTDVIAEKGKSAPKAGWLWLIWLLNFLPGVVFAAAGGREPVFYLIFAITPLSLIVIPLMYKRALLSRRQAVSADKSLNKAYARALERETGLAMIRIFLALSLWWNVFSLLFLAEEPSMWALVLSLIVFSLLLTGLLFYGQKKREKINRRFYEKSSWQLPREDENYRWGFYYNKEDARLMVPKQVEGMGYTLNMAKPAAKVITGLTLLFVVLLLGAAVYMGASKPKFYTQAGYFEIKAPFYSMQLEPEAVSAVEWVEEPIENAVRLHGLAASERRYGAFRLKPYGRINLYVYNQVKEHIVLELSGEGAVRAVVLNEDTPEKTRALYESLEKWHERVLVNQP